MIKAPDTHEVSAAEYFQAIAGKGPELPIREVACVDCAVVDGFYREISDELAMQPRPIIEAASRRWYCHRTPYLACKGNADVCGVARAERTI